MQQWANLRDAPGPAPGGRCPPGRPARPLKEVEGKWKTIQERFDSPDGERHTAACTAGPGRRGDCGLAVSFPTRPGPPCGLDHRLARGRGVPRLMPTAIVAAARRGVRFDLEDIPDTAARPPCTRFGDGGVIGHGCPRADLGLFAAHPGRAMAGAGVAQSTPSSDSHTHRRSSLEAWLFNPAVRVVAPPRHDQQGSRVRLSARAQPRCVPEKGPENLCRGALSQPARCARFWALRVQTRSSTRGNRPTSCGLPVPRRQLRLEPTPPQYLPECDRGPDVDESCR